MFSLRAPNVRKILSMFSLSLACTLLSTQIWGYLSLESGAIYPEMDDASHMSMFDLEISTRASAQVETLLPHIDHVKVTFAPRDAQVIRRKPPVDKIVGALFLQGALCSET